MALFRLIFSSLKEDRTSKFSCILLSELSGFIICLYVRIHINVVLKHNVYYVLEIFFLLKYGEKESFGQMEVDDDVLCEV